MPSRGRPFAPGNKFGRGRPPGSCNKVTHSLQELLQKHGESIIRKCLVVALKGEKQALRLCVERLLPACREGVVRMPAGPIRTAADLSKAAEKLWKRVGSGRSTPGEADRLMTFLERQRRMVEGADFEQRLLRLEDRSNAA